jgi:predicted RNA-binding protein YlxR (DUF448 family)
MEKKAMLRLVMDDAGDVWPDVLQKAPGRGAYLCMQPLCLQRLTDRHLQKAWQKYRIAKLQASALLDQVRQSLMVLCRKELARLRSRLEIGRDAVLRQLQEHEPVSVFLAADAGGALRKSIGHAVNRRPDRTEIWAFPSESEMAGALGRGTAAVVAARSCPQTDQLGQHCAWYGCLI